MNGPVKENSILCMFKNKENIRILKPTFTFG